ncbi:MAG: hypothetical protein LW636_00555 [Planctomycetaceae bacterium]|jgi:hypothetical protein|nr:hypothetical protein [Planctomycetaceae bacterium]
MTDQTPHIGPVRRLLVRLGDIDRRWIYLSMALAVAIPMLTGLSFPETPGKMSSATFDAIESVPAGAKVLFSFDYDPASEGELQPMANAFVHHCAARGHKMAFMALWPLGKQMAEATIDSILLANHPQYRYGEDYVQLGYMPGFETVIKGLTTNFASQYPLDVRGTPIGNIPLMSDVKTLQDFDLIVTVSAGYAGAKEWVQYAKSTYPDAYVLAAGSTGVQANQLFPYYPTQMEGLLAAVKGAAEYETLVAAAYPPPAHPERLEEGRRRMGPQFVAHLLMIGLIVLGNASMFAARGMKGGRR